MAGLDSGRVLLYTESQQWRNEVVWPPSTSDGNRQPCRQVLLTVAEEKQAVWELPNTSAQVDSLSGISVVVATPILNRDDEVVGALFGDRRHQLNEGDAEPISPLQAQLVGLLASGVEACRA